MAARAQSGLRSRPRATGHRASTATRPAPKSRRTTGTARSAARPTARTAARPTARSAARSGARAAAATTANRRAQAPAAPRRRPSTTRRLGPRRLGPRQGASRIQWDRLGRICLVLVITAICFSYFNPAINLFNSYRANSATQESLSRLTAENARLEARTKAVQDPVVLTREARRQGMVLPGERPYVVRGVGG